ncbi:pectinesterase [Clostridium sp.]|uniref:pectinesterase n=1 Tax=Clostridium sp. TaxID=1506 RepID=UPI003F2F8C44
MNSLDKAILQFLSKVSKRIKANFLLNLSIASLKLMLCLSFCLLLVSLFVVIPYAEEAASVIILVGLIISLIYGFIKAPSKEKVALITDSKGLKERLTTSLELIGEEDSISIAQKNDTLTSIENYNLKEKLPIRVEKKQVYFVLGLLLMCFCTSLISTEAKKEAGNIKEFKKYQHEMMNKLEKEIEEVDKLEALTDEEKEATKKVLEDAKKELKEVSNKSELNKTLERLEKKLESQKDKIKNDDGKKALDDIKKNLLEDFNERKKEEAKNDLNKMINELMKNNETKDLAEALMSDNDEDIAKALSELKHSLKDMNSAQLSKLSEGLKKASKEMINEDLAKSLEDASSSVLDGELNSEDLSKALQSVKKDAEGNKGEKSESGEGSGEGEGDGEGGSGSGEGSGNGSGQGSGSGSGQGWDTGSTQGTEKESENKSGEEIFIPGRNEGSDSNLTGNKNEGGNSQQIETENGLNLDGSKVNYDKVIGDYTNSALEGANNSNLPESLKDLIKDYFQGLN